MKKEIIKGGADFLAGIRSTFVITMQYRIFLYCIVRWKM